MVCGLFAPQTILVDAPEKNTARSSMNFEELSWVGTFFMHKMTDFLCSYLQDSFRDNRKAHPVATHVFDIYIEGKHIQSDINRTYFDLNLLQKALLKNDLETTKILLFLGADPYLKNDFEMSAIHLARDKKMDQFVQLYQRYEPMYQNYQAHENSSKHWYQKLVDSFVRVVAPFQANQGLEYIVQTLQEYGKTHYWLSKIFMYGVVGYRFDTLMNQSWYTQNFLQYCIVNNDLDFARTLLYLGANPLQKNRFGAHALETALHQFESKFVALFFKYLSVPALKAELYSQLQKYLPLLLLSGLQEYGKSGSIYFLSDVAQYFGVLHGDIAPENERALIAGIVEMVNAECEKQYGLQPIQKRSRDSYQIPALRIAHGSMQIISGPTVIVF